MTRTEEFIMLFLTVGAVFLVVVAAVFLVSDEPIHSLACTALSALLTSWAVCYVTAFRITR